MPPEAPRKAPAVLAAAFFAALGAALFFPSLFLDRLIFGYDTLALGLPYHAEVLRSLDAHQWPLWMPGLLGGMPGIAACNLYFTYPIAFFGCLARLPFPLLLGLDAALSVAAAGTGMFLLLRRLRLGTAAALLGAFFFAVSGPEISQLNGGYFNFLEGVAWTPWIFWAAHKGLRERSLFGWGLCGAALALQVLAGASQLCLYALAALAASTLAAAWTPAREGRRESLGAAAAGLGLALLTAALLSAPQSWTTLRYLPYTARQGWSRADLLDGAVRPSEALSWIVPGFFGWQWPTYHGGMASTFGSEYLGLLPLCLASGALGALWRRDARVRRLAWLALAAFFFAQDRWTPFYALFRSLPVLSGFRIWSRTLFLDAFAACALAALGWDALAKPETRPAALRGCFAFLLLAAALAAAAWALAPGQARAGIPKVLAQGLPPRPDAIALLQGMARDSAARALELCAALLALLGLFSRAPRAAPALAAAFAFHACDQSCVYNRFVRFMDPAAAAAPPAFTRTPPPPPGLEPWRVYDSDKDAPNRAMLLGYENLAGRESMPMRSSRDLAQALRRRPAAYYDLLGERYLFSSAGPGGRVDILENRRAYPRAWLVGEARTVPDAGGAYRLLADPAFNPRVEAALPADLGLKGGVPRGSVRWLERGPQSFSLDVASDRPAALLVSNFWVPDWKAELDGRETPVLLADGALQAIAVPAGEHRADFRYDEGPFDGALAACLAGLVLLLGLGWMERGGGTGR